MKRGAIWPWEIDKPYGSEADNAEKPKWEGPTRYMEAIVDLLTKQPEIEFSQGQVLKVMQSLGVGGRESVVRDALNRLLADQRIEARRGGRGAILYRGLRQVNSPTPDLFASSEIDLSPPQPTSAQFSPAGVGGTQSTSAQLSPGGVPEGYPPAGLRSPAPTAERDALNDLSPPPSILDLLN